MTSTKSTSLSQTAPDVHGSFDAVHALGSLLGMAWMPGYLLTKYGSVGFQFLGPGTDTKMHPEKPEQSWNQQLAPFAVGLQS